MRKQAVGFSKFDAFESFDQLGWIVCGSILLVELQEMLNDISVPQTLAIPV